MTRDEFIEEVTTFWDLVSFCNENSLEHIVEDIRDGEDYDEYLNENFVDLIRCEGWREARDGMCNIDNDGYDWYRVDDYDGEWYSLDDDYDLGEYKDMVLDEMDDADAWDEPEDEDEECEYEQEDEEEPEPCVPDEDTERVNAEELLAINSQLLVQMMSDKDEENTEDGDASDDKDEDECDYDVSVYDLIG